MFYFINNVLCFSTPQRYKLIIKLPNKSTTFFKKSFSKKVLQKFGSLIFFNYLYGKKTKYAYKQKKKDNHFIDYPFLVLLKIALGYRGKHLLFLS